MIARLRAQAGIAVLVFVLPSRLAPAAPTPDATVTPPLGARLAPLVDPALSSSERMAHVGRVLSLTAENTAQPGAKAAMLRVRETLANSILAGTADVAQVSALAALDSLAGNEGHILLLFDECRTRKGIPPPLLREVFQLSRPFLMEARRYEDALSMRGDLCKEAQELVARATKTGELLGGGGVAQVLSIADMQALGQDHEALMATGRKAEAACVAGFLRANGNPDLVEPLLEYYGERAILAR